MGCVSSAANSHGYERRSSSPGEEREEQLLDKYALGRVLGQGAFGIVYSCRRKGDKQEFAVKMVDQVETPLAEIKQEVDMLKKLAHPCVVKLHDVFYEKVFVCIVLEIYKGGDMIEGMQMHWKAHGMVPVNVVQNVSKMMFHGVSWLHQNDVVHRDLKGDNYLMDRKDLENPACRIYLSDFGTVLDLPPGARLRQKCGTKTYWAPEFYALNYGKPVDVWALGVVMFGLITGRFPFKGEEDVKNKAIKVPSRMTPEGIEFVLGTLAREEAKRLTAIQAMSHPFLANIKSADQVAAEKEGLDPTFQPLLRENGANAGVQDRRRELVERLEEQEKKKTNPRPSHIENKLWFLDFTVVDRHSEKQTSFKWLNVEEFKTAKLLDERKASKVKDEDFQSSVQASESGIRDMLEQHCIDTSKFGTGSAKKFVEFVHEVQLGQSRLMMDAAKHKKVVRVVDVVLLRIVAGTGPKKQFLIVTHEKFPDDRSRGNIAQLPGMKRLPHENGITTARRAVEERLAMADCGLDFNYLDKEYFEDDEDSPSFPGVKTVYRKEIYEATLSVQDEQVLARIGLEGGKVGGTFSFKAKDMYTRTFTWMSEAQCLAKKALLRAPAEGHGISTLVHVPIGLEEKELHAFLTANKVDVDQFGKDGSKSLAEFSDELIRGEAALQRDANGKILRIVDVVILKICKKNGDVLVEAGSKSHTVNSTEMRLPAVKRRSDENAFLAAHRVCSKVLKINENTLTLDPDNVLMVEELTSSKHYAGLPTLYKKRIIRGTPIE